MAASTDDEAASAAAATAMAVRVIEVVTARTTLPQRDVCALLLVSPAVRRALLANSKLWQVIDLHEMRKAGDRLISALSLDRYKHVKTINLEFAQDIEDNHFILLKNKNHTVLDELKFLNLNACQKLTDKGIQILASICPNLQTLSLYWNVGLTDLSISSIAKHCKMITDLNLSGCKNITDNSLQLLEKSYPALKSLNITRCVKLTDDGLLQILQKCTQLESLNLYALSSFTDKAYTKLALLNNLTFIDLCGAQNLSDQGLNCLAKCRCLTYVNLTWCTKVTDIGVIAIAQGCRSLELLSLFGITGVTDKCLEYLSTFCSDTLTTLDVNGCINIKGRTRDALLLLFPHLRCFKVHS